MKLKTLFTALLIALSAPLAMFAKDATLTVKGMPCAFCAQGIEKKFKRNAAVKDVKVDLDSGKVVISFKDKGDITDEQFQKMITDSGYTLEKIER